jgi:hypothetical protein
VNPAPRTSLMVLLVLSAPTANRAVTVLSAPSPGVVEGDSIVMLLGIVLWALHPPADVGR